MLIRFLALLIFLLITPILIFLFIAVTIEDGLPFFFIQKRAGKGHVLFNMYKIRTMKLTTPDVASHLLKEPNRHILKTGKFIRRTSLDELPNLINVIKGEMVFVGPRPALHNQRDLLSLREVYGISALMPGITGWAQINGRDDLSIEHKVKLDQEYLSRRTLLFDIKIILKTFLRIWSGKGVSH